MRKSRISCKNITDFSHCLCRVWLDISKISGRVAGYWVSDFWLLFESEVADVPSLEVPAGPLRGPWSTWPWSTRAWCTSTWPLCTRPCTSTMPWCTKHRASALQGSSSRRASRRGGLGEVGRVEEAGWCHQPCITSWAGEPPGLLWSTGSGGQEVVVGELLHKSRSTSSRVLPPGCSPDRRAHPARTGEGENYL